MTKARTYPRTGLHGAVVHDIGVRILRGDLAPGDPLPTEEDLGPDLAVSRTVVREAVKVLAAKRLVESRPKTGTRVRPRRDWNLLDPDVLAWQVEAGPDRRFLAQAQIAALVEAAEGMAAAGDDIDAFMGPDLRFHALLLEATGNELLEHMTSIFASVLRTVFSHPTRPPGAYPRAAVLHLAIVEAIRAHDPEAAEAALHTLARDTVSNLEWAKQRGLSP
jgi:DNA-binding FadR family transcriptional regulator